MVDRRTNREIAEVLFLSPKTVETHIRNIFNKLDADSRVEVARIVERADRRAAMDAYRIERFAYDTGSVALDVASAGLPQEWTSNWPA